MSGDLYYGAKFAGFKARRGQVLAQAPVGALHRAQFGRERSAYSPGRAIFGVLEVVVVALGGLGVAEAGVGIAVVRMVRVVSRLL